MQTAFPVAFRTVLVTALVASLLPAGAAKAAVPPVINFQGRLLDDTGVPEAGIQSVGFALYDSDSGGAPLWSETQTVAFADGFYSVMLGSITPLPVSVLNDPVYLSVSVGGTELLPRMPVASVPFALRADLAESLVASATGSGSGLDADSLDGLDSGDIALAGHSHAPGDADTLDGIDSTGFLATSTAGARIEFGTAVSDATEGGTDTFTTVTFGSAFAAPPAVLIHSNTNSGGDEFVVNVQNVTATSFEFQLDEVVAIPGTHNAETFGWIAIGL